MEEMQAEDQRKAATAVSNLLEEIESKYAETSISLTKVMSQQAAIHQDFTEEITRIQGQARDHFEKILLEHQRITMQLEARKKELEEREKELEKREEEMEKREKAHNESEKRRIYYDKEMKEKLKLITELEKKLDAKQALDLEIEFLKGALQITTHMGENGDMNRKIAMYKKKEELEDKVKELESLEALNQVLVVRERKRSDELQEVRKELISYFKHRSTCASIGVKLMGDLEIKPFYQALKRKYSGDEADEKALEFCSLWEKNLKDPSWYPFKVITVGGNVKEIIDEEDERLKSLRNEYGGDVYKAVTDAFKEKNEYNPTGGYCVSELWNFKEGRKATLTEGVKQILKEWGLFKRKRM